MNRTKKKILVIRYHNSAMDISILGEINDVSVGDYILVNTEDGWQFALINKIFISPDFGDIPETEIKKATEEDLERLKHINNRELEAKRACQQYIDANNIPMKLIRAVLSSDGSKVTFYYTSDDRVDFRDMVVELATELRVRIEMKQIGVRDEAKMLGGIGICSRKLCCSSSLDEFKSITIRMAKEQNINISPDKISGLCGRLMCCFHYELENYRELSDKLPEAGDTVYYKGFPAEVKKVKLLKREIIIDIGDENKLTVKPEEITTDKPGSMLSKTQTSSEY